MSASPRKKHGGKHHHHSSIGPTLADRLQPLYLSLAWLVIFAFPIESTDNYSNHPVQVFSTTFQASILRVIATEVFEVNDAPATFESLKTETDALIKREVKIIKRRNDKIRARGQQVVKYYEAAENIESWMSAFAKEFATPADGCVCLDNIERELKNRISEDEDDLPPDMLEPLERRSPLGLFFRSILLSLRKLSFDDTAALSKQISHWCGHGQGGPSRRAPGIPSGSEGSEEVHDRRSKALRHFQTATSSGDHSGALTALRRFYDYRSPSVGHGQRQHALLNLAAFHYTTGGLEAAGATIEEAIRVARAEGDSPCLQQCISLLHRLRTETDVAILASSRPRVKQAPLEGRLPKPALPEDDLWLLKAALDLGEPVHIAFRRVYRALARLDCFGYEEGAKDKEREKDGEKNREMEREDLKSVNLGAWHVTQAALWELIGSETLTEIHQEQAKDDSDDIRFTILFSNAEKLSTEGKVNDALGLLLNYENLHGMTIVDYHRWAEVVWTILERQALLTGDDEYQSIIASLRGPNMHRIGPGGPPRDTASTNSVPIDSSTSNGTTPTFTLAQNLIRDELRHSRKMLDANAPPHLVLMHILSAAQLAKELGTWRLYRVAVVSIGEVLIAMDEATAGTANGPGITKDSDDQSTGNTYDSMKTNTTMAQRAIDEISAVWEQIGSDQETISRAALVLSKAKTSLALDYELDNPTYARELLDQAYEHAKESITAAETVESEVLLKKGLELVALLAEAKGERDEVVSQLVKRWESIKRGQGGGERAKTRRETARKVGQIVTLVGARVAEGWE